MENNLQQQLSAFEAENQRLKQENHQLKQLLKQHNIPFHTNKQNTHPYNKEIKRRLAIFKDLFKGRNDVYAIRWENQKGETGYSPVTRKASNHPSKQYIPLTDQTIYHHLTGEQVIGLYPLLQDNTCWFLALDFDKAGWQKESRALFEVCQQYQVPAAMERSRSGNGCHVWIFFSEPIPAETARQLGDFFIQETLKRYQWTKMPSFDRMFPTQDRRKDNGLGNLIALPLQKEARHHHNSVFIDDQFQVIANQWEYLRSLDKINVAAINDLLSSSQQEVPPADIIREEGIPQQVNLLLKNGIYINKSELSVILLEEILKLASFSNPNYYKAKAQRRSTHRIPKVLDCSEQDAAHVILPRGCWPALTELLQHQSIEWTVQDESYQGQPLSTTFQGELTFQQEEALSCLLNHTNGIVAAAMGFGKTVVAASLIAKRNVNTLIIVPSKQLLQQWKEKLLAFLDVEEASIGQMGGGKYKPSHIIDIATIQTLNSNRQVKDIVTEYGQVIVDECHHISAFSFEAVLKKVQAKYVYGLTATPSRRDGLQFITNMQCGPIIYKLTAKKQAKIHPFQHILIPRYTSFKSELGEKEKTFMALGSELVQDEARNKQIFNDVLAALDQGAKPLILTERIEHINLLESMFKGFVKNIIVLNGNLTEQEKKEQVGRLNRIEDNEYLIIATGKYIGEGFDDDKLDCLFLVYPISWKGALQQYVGRLHRVHQDKSEVRVYDYIDHQEPILQNSYESRLKGYHSLGYKVKGDHSDGAEQMEMF
ncbi:DEAD/DEAH box helicase [Gracilibacillus timonensis]|uniref:DEAD/DEAH box helicase n=1 Tax=Gracilibacillus timonensis TaxID=1816696 RepID=UPI0008266CB6|nr:DEAD/DEAH box helicase [Gracilibacillus timonensis]